MALKNVTVEIAGSVWKVETELGAKVTKDTVLLILESMKMEIPLISSHNGIIKEIMVQEGDVVSEGDVVIVLEIE